MFRRIRYRFMRTGEEDQIIHLITQVFTSNVAPQYSPEGVHEFLKYARSDDLLKRAMRDHFVLVAEFESKIIAMMEIKKYNHIALFFVAEPFQHRGVGRQLLKRALRICRRRDPWLKEVSVNASPNAVKAYTRMGFVPHGAEKTIKGIRFVPMTIAFKRYPLFRHLV